MKVYMFSVVIENSVQGIYIYILGPVVETYSLPSLIYPDLRTPRTATWSTTSYMMAKLK